MAELALDEGARRLPRSQPLRGGRRLRHPDHPRVTVDANPHMRRGRWQPSHDGELESLATLCLAGPAAEELFCGPITDGTDRYDIAMAGYFLTRRSDPSQVGAAIMRLRDDARGLVRTAWARSRIDLIAGALKRRGTLTGDEIGVVIAACA